MAVIIGAGTTVTFSQGTCVTSVSWGANPNIQRLYCLGSWTPELTIEKPEESMNLTIYAPGTSFSVAPSTGCEIASQVSASVDPAGCGAGVPAGVTGMWFVNSYSYSKDDAQMPGQESWSLMRWVGTTPPNYVIRGIAEGSATGDAGVTFTGATTESTTGNVSAGGIGRADTLTMGQVTSVGGGSSDQGDTGTGNASIPHTPLWID